MHRFMICAAICVTCFSSFRMAEGQQSQGRTVSVFIFDARVRSFAPGIEAVLTLTDEQKNKLGTVYNETLGVPAVSLANSVLQDVNASYGQRQMAGATVLQAQAAFRAKSREVFTPQQRDLIDKVYLSFNKITAKVQEDATRQVKTDIGRDLDALLSPEQKAAMAKLAAEDQAARDKAAASGAATEQKKPANNN